MERGDTGAATGEKQRLKLEKFRKKKEKQLQEEQQQVLRDGIGEKCIGKPKAGPITAKATDWVEETPAGQRKILKSLDDNFHRAYIPSFVESAWYDYWEQQNLFKPRTADDGSAAAKGIYAIAIPPPNV